MSARRVQCFSTLILALVFCAPGVHGQISSTATINGSVRDTSGAPVADAKVTVTNEGTGVSFDTVSNTDGDFVAPGLQVGSYRVTVVKEGFRTYVEEHIPLHPTVVSTVAVVLSVGQVTTEVTVSASAAQVQTATPELSSDVSQQQVSTLPLNGRNYQGLSALMPGVTNTSPDTALNQGGFLTSNVISVNGMGTSGTQYFLDGIWNENTGNMTQTTITPNPDTLQEVRVLENSFGVQYSLNGANVVMLETKTGTSHFHGSAFEYLRNDDLDARNFFASTVPPLKQNIFGYTIGGPVYIPGHYNTDKSKTFFFWSQQWTRQNVGSVVLGADPTPAMRTGDFSSLCTTGFSPSGICSTASEQLTNPATGQPFPNNMITTPLNPDAVTLLNALAQPPNNGTGFLNFINLNPAINNTRDDEIRGDHNFTEKVRLMAEYLDERQTNGNPYDTFLGSPYTTNKNPIYTTNQLAQVRLTATLSSSMVNTTSLAMNNYVVSLAASGLWQLSQLPGFSENLPYKGGVGSNRLPEVDFAGGWPSIGWTYDLPLNHASDLEDTLSDDWSWLRGNHFIQAGGNIVFGTKRQNNFSATNGDWFFSGLFTGDPIADFLLGDAASFTQTTNEPRYYLHYRLFSPYVQDRWKITPRLSLTAGIRIEFEPPPNLQRDFGSFFDAKDYNPAEAPVVNNDGTITPTANYNPQNGIIINGVNGVPLNFTTVHQWYWSPAFGFAYDVFGNGKTAVRGGFQMTTQNAFYEAGGNGAPSGNPPFVESLTLITPPFPNPIGAAAAPPPAPTFSGEDVNTYRSPTYSNYNLSVEHQFSHNWLVSIATAGTVGRHLFASWNINQPFPDAPYDFNPIINSGTVFPYVASNFVPYLGYAAINNVEFNDNLYWNALEIHARHPIGHDLFLNVAYTWQHGLGDATVSGSTGAVSMGETSPQNIYNPGASYGTESFNAPQVFSTSLIWGLPWFHNAPGIKGIALGGWQYSDITTIQSGFALTPGLSIATPGLATYPDRVAGSSVAGPKTAAEWFNTAAFTAPAAGYFGNAAPGSIPGPGVIDFDMAFYKDFRIREGLTLQFRGEAFNIFNHTNFSGVQTAYGTGNYGQVTSALDPRKLEFALRLQF
jgi:hypothetical protein